MRKMTRRGFTRISAAGAAAMAGIGSPSAAVRSSGPSPNERLTVGLIGAGGMGMGDLKECSAFRRWIAWPWPMWTCAG